MGEPLKIIVLITWITGCGGCRHIGEWTNDFSCAINACTMGDCTLRGQPSSCLAGSPCPADPCCDVTAKSEAISGEEAETTAPVATKQECRIVAPIGPKCPIRHLAGASKTKCRAQRPEPTIAYEPPPPPKFLLVPTQKVFSNVNMTAPTPRRGDVEVGFGPQLDIPGHD